MRDCDFTKLQIKLNDVTVHVSEQAPAGEGVLPLARRLRRAVGRLAPGVSCSARAFGRSVLSMNPSHQKIQVTRKAKACIGKRPNRGSRRTTRRCIFSAPQVDLRCREDLEEVQPPDPEPAPVPMALQAARHMRWLQPRLTAVRHLEIGAWVSCMHSASRNHQRPAKFVGQSAQQRTVVQ